jgi:hypothetical protein
MPIIEEIEGSSFSHVYHHVFHHEPPRASGFAWGVGGSSGRMLLSAAFAMDILNSLPWRMVTPVAN